MRFLILLLLLCGFDHFDQAPDLPTGYNVADAIKLDLPEALRLAMRRHLGIAVERKQMEMTELAEDAARSAMYEPTLSGSVTQDGLWSVTASSQLPTGGHVEVSGGSGVRFSFTQPLLRGFSTDLSIPRYTILTARIATEQQRHALEISAAALVRETEAAYWDVVYSLYSYDVTARSKQLAADTVVLIQRQIDVGLAPPADLIGAKATLAQRELAVLDAAQAVEQSWDALRTLIDLPRDQWQRPLLPLDRPQRTTQAPPAPDAAFKAALAHRPELAMSDLEIEASRLAIRKADNAARPQLDAGVTVGSDGVSAMVTWSWQPWSGANRAAKKQARLEHDVRLLNHDQRVQAIWNEVRTAVRGQRAAQLELAAAANSRKLAADSLDVETRKYVDGSSSSLNVATLQSGLASAELTELGALISYEKARTGVLLATGQLLSERHVELVGEAPSQAAAHPTRAR